MVPQHLSPPLATMNSEEQDAEIDALDALGALADFARCVGVEVWSAFWALCRQAFGPNVFLTS